MPVDYSKWDALELSDDSDIEVHPNVDKRSFIRAKQNQIHQQRIDRRHRITTLKYERVVNEGLLSRIDALLKALSSHRADVEKQGDSADKSAVDEAVFDCLTDVTSDGTLGEDKPPGAPPGVHKNEVQPSYTQMMGALVDQVRAEVEKTAPNGLARYDAFVKEVRAHQTKVTGLQKDLNVELAKLEKEEGSKITSESIHTGFNSSHIAKPAPTPAAGPVAKKAEPELLNPSRPAPSDAAATLQTTTGGDDDEEDMKVTPLGQKFGRIAFGDYRSSLQFISQHPEILVERETDGLLVEAFDAQTKAKSKQEEDYARQCVHQALLLQYCRQLGKDGVGLFFQRVQTQGHSARKLFLDDVNSTYARIRERSAELAKLAQAEGSGDREQIQLHAVNPNTKINIVTPPPMEQCTTEDERAAREIFEKFTPALQTALESGSLDKVNEVLGKLSVEDAEAVVEQLGNGGMLSLEEGVIDATTDEGKKAIEEIERTHRMPGQAGVVEEIVEDPGMD